MDDKLIIIAPSLRYGDAYAYSNGIENYIVVTEPKHLIGYERGVKYVFTHDFYLSKFSKGDFKEIILTREMDEA